MKAYSSAVSWTTANYFSSFVWQFAKLTIITFVNYDTAIGITMKGAEFEAVTQQR